MKEPNNADVKKLLKHTNRLLASLVVLMSIFFVYYTWDSYQTRYQTRLGFGLTVQALEDIDSVIRRMRVY